MKKDGFTSKLGFVLAAAGSAIGLGNIWRFPYLTAKYGGGIFLLTYLILAITFGYALLISENCIGRMTRKGPIGAFRALCPKDGPWFLRVLRPGGWIVSLVPMLILPYYCVIGGWVTKYAVVLMTNPASDFSRTHLVADGSGNSVVYSELYFKNFITSTWEPLVYFLLFMAVLFVVASYGVKKGVERFNRILMPLLFLLILGICIYSVFLPSAGAGFRYYLKPDLSRFSFMTVVAAMGQLFFSLSIAMGIMITYGSYMRRSEDLVSSVNQVEFYDTAIAFLSGMMIIPAVVAFGGEKAAENAGPGLVFITMPQVFANFPGGRFVGIAFFVLVLFAAATSAISLLETNIQTVCQELRISRLKALAVCTAEIVVIGVLTILGYSLLSHIHPLAFIEKCKGMDILDSLDFISNSILMPVSALFITLLVLFAVGLNRFTAEIRRGAHWRRERLYRFCMTVLVIPCLLLILLYSVGFFG